MWRLPYFSFFAGRDVPGIKTRAKLAFFCCDKTLWLKATWERFYFSLQFYSITNHWGKSGQELTRGSRSLEAGADSEAMEACCFCSPWLAQPVFLEYVDYQPRASIAHSELSLPTSVISQGNAWDLPMDLSIWTFSQLRFFLMTILVKLLKN